MRAFHEKLDLNAYRKNWPYGKFLKENQKLKLSENKNNKNSELEIRLEIYVKKDGREDVSK